LSRGPVPIALDVLSRAADALEAVWNICSRSEVTMKQLNNTEIQILNYLQNNNHATIGEIAKNINMSYKKVYRSIVYLYCRKYVNRNTATSPYTWDYISRSGQ